MQNAWWWVGLLCLACSKRESPATTASAEPIQSAAPKLAPSARVERPPSPFRLVKEFPSGKFFPVGSAAILCETPCVFKKGPPPKVWLIEGDKVEEKPELWPGHAYQQYLPTLKEEGEGSAPVLYDGEYPDKLYAVGVSGSRVWGGLPTVKFVKKYWAESRNGVVRGSHSTDRGLPPREYDDALVTAPVTYTPEVRFFFGAGGPTIVLDSHAFHEWDGKAWTKKTAPWNETPEGARLADGRTLVTTEAAAYLVDKQGEVAPVELPKGASELRRYEIGGKLWLTSEEKGVSVYRSELRTFDEPKRKAAASKPKEPVEGGANEPSQAPFTDACPTPFVVLATPPSIDSPVPTLAKGLQGHTELSAALSFVAYKLGAQPYFGAQAKDEASARKLIDVIKSAILGIRPQLVCMDALSHLPDPYDPPAGIRRVWLHLGSGVELRLR